MSKHTHAEAFMLMEYRADDNSESEFIWNSRDGVTPFIMTLKSGKVAHHVNWANDKYLPDYQPKAGERIFIDMTMERANELAQVILDRYAAQGYTKKYDHLDIKHLIEELYKDGKAPDIKEIM